MFSDSYGASMSAKVRVFLDMAFSSVPERLVAFSHMVDDYVDRRGLDAGSEPRVRDAPLAEGEIVGEHSHARLHGGRQALALRAAAGGQDAVLHEQERHLVPRL